MLDINFNMPGRDELKRHELKLSQESSTRTSSSSNNLAKRGPRYDTGSSTLLFSMTSRRSSSDILNFSATASTSVASTPLSSSAPGKDLCRVDQLELHRTLCVALEPKTVVIMVGLPASGKSTVTKQILETLRQQGIFCDVYNSGNLRREEYPQQNKQDFNSSAYFDPDNCQASQERENFALQSLSCLLEDLKSNRISCGFLDATNSTMHRRHLLIEYIRNLGVQVSNVVILNVEVQNKDYLRYNVSLKTTNNDYKDKDFGFALKDFEKRAKHYQDNYQPVSQQELQSYKGVVNHYFTIKDAGNEVAFCDLNENPQADKTVGLVKEMVLHYKENYGNEYRKLVVGFTEMGNGK